MKPKSFNSLSALISRPPANSLMRRRFSTASMTRSVSVMSASTWLR